MKLQSAFGPVSLRYIAALRGIMPERTGREFAYAEATCAAPENLVCLAASNPEGRFYGFVSDEDARRAAEEIADERTTHNVVFLSGSPSDMLARIDNGSTLPPMLDILCCDERSAPLPESERAALFDLARKRLNPGGLFVTSYRAYDREDGALRFLVQQLAHVMDSEQKQDFLTEIKKLGSVYLAKHIDTADLLDKAIADRAPLDFFSLFEDAPGNSETFAAASAMTARGFSYAGDATLSSNYVELAVPHEAQDLIVSCRNNPVYEPIKDFALNRAARSDIWIKMPFDASNDPAQLFGGFAYGLLLPREEVPSAYAAKGKMIDLSSPLYAKVLDLMSIMPIGVGNALSHESCRDEDPAKILEAFQILVACGFASPMRGARVALSIDNVAQPRLVGGFNRFLDRTALTDADVLFASHVAGCGYVVPAREAYVMQAVNRAGLNDSVTALMPELKRIAETSVALSIMNTATPTAKIAHGMILDVVAKSLPTWYAYGLLEAA